MLLNWKNKGYYDFYGGMDDKEDAIEVPTHLMKHVENGWVNRTSIERRRGYKTRFDGELESGRDSLHAHLHFDEVDGIVDTKGILQIIAGSGANGVLYYDNGSTRTDISTTNTVLVENTLDDDIQVTNYNGEMVGCDGVNPMWHSDGTAAGTKTILTDITASTGAPFPTKIHCVASFKEHLFIANFTDIDNSYRPYRILINRPGDITDWPLDTNNDLDRSDRIVAIVPHGEHLLFFMRRNIYWAEYKGSQGFARAPFHFHSLISGVGAISAKSIKHTQQGTFFLSERGGVWFIPLTETNGAGKAKFVGKPMSKFWGTLTGSKRRRIVAINHINRNSLLWLVPVGTGQVYNNRAIVMNYEEWHRDGPQTSGSRGDIYPAFSFFTGEETSDQNTPFRFSTGVEIYDDTEGTWETILCNLGKTYDFDNPTDPVEYDATEGNGIRMIVNTPFYSPGGRANKKIWRQVTLDASMKLATPISLKQLNYNSPHVITRNPTGVAYGHTLGSSGTFILGSSILGSNQDGSIIANMEGSSRYTQFVIDTGVLTHNFSMHGIVLYYTPGGSSGHSE
tara:strand:- start:1480 stop:3174 length:1695 start_codon:yes stop_codon:yes gene_type:complete